MIFLDLSKGDFYNALKAFVQCITFTPPSSGVEKRGSSIALDSTIGRFLQMLINSASYMNQIYVFLKSYLMSETLFIHS